MDESTLENSVLGPSNGDLYDESRRRRLLREVAAIAGNHEILMILTASVAIFVGCVVFFLWRRSTAKSSKSLEPLKPMVMSKELEFEVDDEKKKVTIFFRTQTRTVEGFAKPISEDANARYEKAAFRIVDLDDYAADDDEYEEKLKIS